MIDDLHPDDWANSNIVAKPIVWTILSRIHSQLPKPLEYSINFKVDYNYNDIFRNDIPSENLIEASLRTIDKSVNDIFYKRHQYKDKHIPEMNLYPRPRIIHKFISSQNKHA